MMVVTAVDRSNCTCELCKTLTEIGDSETVSEDDHFRQMILQFRNNLGSSRSCVGRVSLSTGFSLQLIEMAVNKMGCLDSIENILSSLPVYRKVNAETIFDILQSKVRYM